MSTGSITIEGHTLQWCHERAVEAGEEILGCAVDAELDHWESVIVTVLGRVLSISATFTISPTSERDT